MVKVASLTDAQIYQGTGQQWAEEEGTRWAAGVTALLQRVSNDGVPSRASSVEEAVAYATALLGDGSLQSVYWRVREEKCKLRWGHKRLAQHMKEQRFYANYFNLLRRSRPLQFTGPIHVMYGGAAWGAIKGRRRGPVKGVRRRFERERGFVVHEVHEHLTSMTHWASGQRLSAVAAWDEKDGWHPVRGLLRLPAKNNSVSGPPIYVNRDFNAACNILLAGLREHRPPHLCAGQPKVDRRTKSVIRTRPTWQQQQLVVAGRWAAAPAGGAVALPPLAVGAMEAAPI
jgi:hypothetical protein